MEIITTVVDLRPTQSGLYVAKEQFLCTARTGLRYRVQMLFLKSFALSKSVVRGWIMRRELYYGPYQVFRTDGA